MNMVLLHDPKGIRIDSIKRCLKNNKKAYYQPSHCIY